MSPVTRRIVFVLVLTTLLVSLQVQRVHEVLTRGGWGPLPVRVERASLVVSSLERGPGVALFAQAGLREGDVIEAARDGNGDGGSIKGLGDLVDARRNARVAPPLSLTIRRPSAGGARQTIEVTPGPARSGAFLAFDLAWTILLPAASLTAALLLGLLKPEDTRAMVGSLLFFAFAGTFGLEPLALPPSVRALATVLRVLCTFGLGALFLWFFLIFPTPSIIDRQLPWLKHIAVGLANIGAGIGLALELSELSSLATYERLRAWLPEGVIGRGFQIVAIACIGIGLVSLTLNTLRPQSRDDRRRMLIVLVGTIVSLAPFVAISTWLAMTDRPPNLRLFVLLGLSISFFPLSVVYAVVRHRVLGIRLILRRGAQYALISAGFQVLAAALVFLLFWYVVGPLLSPIAQGPVPSGFVAAGAALSAARLLRNVRGRVMPAIDRRFFRDAYDARRVLTDLSHSVRELALEPERLLTRLVDTVSVTLHPRTTAVLMQAIDPETGRPSGPFRCVALRRDEGRPLEAADIVVPADGLVVRRVRPPDDETPVGPVDVFLDETRSWAHVLVTDRAFAAERAVLEALGVQLVVPLAAGARLLGLIVLGEKRSEEFYSRDDKELLATVAEQTALALDYGQLAQRAAREESLRKEVEIARDVQTRLFPQVLPVMGTLDYAGVCRPAREVGGDSYDFIALGEGRLGLALSDISGKGIAAALLMASLQALLRSHAPLPGRDLKDLAADVNRLLVASIPDNRFATLFYGVFDAERRTLTYINAGHNPPMLLRPGAAMAQRLEPTGMMLGVFDDAVFGQATVDMQDGDLLVVYSDGVCDALNPDGEDYGDGRLESFVRTHTALPAPALMDRILEDVTTFGQGVPPFDDMTLVIAKVRGAGERRG
jgi:sigma-B regulation protein RsbU (phosphoserine phosphatase)